MLYLKWSVSNLSPHMQVYTAKLLFVSPHIYVWFLPIFFSPYERLLSYTSVLILDIPLKNVNERPCSRFLTRWSCIMLGLYIMFTKRAWEITSPGSERGGPQADFRSLVSNTWQHLLIGHHRARSTWLTCQEMSNQLCPFCPLIALNVSWNALSFSILVEVCFTL